MPNTKLSALTHEDINLYFANSFIRIVGLEKAPVWKAYTGFNHQKEMVFKESNGPYAKSLHVPKEVWQRKLVVSTIFPVGFFNFGTTTVYCERKPVRQVTQGLNSQNFSIEIAENLCTSLGMLSGLPADLKAHFMTAQQKEARFKWSSQNFNEIFETQEETDVEKDFDEVRRGAKFSRRISPSFAIFPHPGLKGVLILFRKMIVAECVKAKEIKILVPEFAEEVNDTFLPHDFTTKVAA